ncbi:PAS domain-containing protein [Methylobacterium sp. ID0610]|uniref:PAS domain-containing protein n=1 Tax=Methylobacterium carpenticola TaxID=3344827 RepID=UPI0036B9C69F
MNSQAGPTDAIVDPARLAALDRYDILDTKPEQGFDDVVQLATQICRTPVALVSLVAKDRQWFKARTGFAACQTDLGRSVCAHALTGEDVLIIPDLTGDPRTRDNPLVTGEPRIRFYAGAPLRTPEGLTLGALCVIDTQPRPEGLTDEQQGGLRALARQVMMQLELRRAVENRGQALAARARAEEQLRLAAEATGIGVFDFNPVSGELRWDARVRALFGVPERGPVGYEDTFLRHLHPADRGRADADVRRALDPSGTRTFDTEYRVIAADTGEERWLAARGQAIVEGGATVRFIGTVRDVTARKRADLALKTTAERYRLAARATTDAIWDWDLATNHVLWNEALTEAYGHGPETTEPTGEWWIARIHPEDRARIDASIHATIDGTGSAWSDHYRFERADGSYAPVLDRGYVIRDEQGRAVRMIGAMLDLTGIRSAEAAQQTSEAWLRTVLDTVPVGILFAEAPSGRILGGNGRLETILRHPVLRSAGAEDYGEWIGFHADGRRMAGGDYPLARVIREGLDHAAAEVEYQRGDGTRAWISVAAAAMRDAEGRLTGAVAAISDIDARKRAEAMQALLNQELSHRMKNLMAMVQAVTVQTMRGATDLETVREVLAARLITLGKAHDILLDGVLERASLAEVVNRGIGIRAEVADRVDAAGPVIEIGARAALSLALMLHELTTNATKYGALSVPEGRVRLTWDLAEGAEGPDLCLLWEERGGPPVTPPDRKGFGSRLIERGLTGQVGGTLSLAYEPAGVICRARAPLQAFLADG